MPSLYVYLGLALAIFSLGLGAGYKAKDVLVKAEQSTVLKLERAKLVEVRELNKTLLSELSAKEAEIKVETKIVNREVIRYVPTIQKTDSECNISVESKRLLTSLIDPVSAAPRGTVSPDTRPSDIRTSDLITNLTINLGKYKVAQARCNSLISWFKQQKID